MPAPVKKTALRTRTRKVSASPSKSRSSKLSPKPSPLLPLPPLPLNAEPYPDEMVKLDALVRDRGLLGLREEDLLARPPLDPAVLQSLALRLEEVGRVRILSFGPLSLVAKDAVDFLGAKIVPYIKSFHATHPKDAGLDLERLARHFDVPPPILRLALKTLVHEGRIHRDGAVFALAGFQKMLPLREEKMLEQLETLCFGGDFRAVSLNDIREQFNLTPSKLESMLALLIERRRVVQGKEGFYLHARWLEELTQKLRSLNKREMTIAEFKAMTGLSRKFAIPLLELLDEMGVTRRHGSIREILGGGA